MGLNFSLVGMKGPKEFEPKMREWILPYWYEWQNDPSMTSYAVGVPNFKNKCYRSWTTLRAGISQELLQVDRYGVIYLPKQRISIEIWIHNGENIYTPSSYSRISQKLGSGGALETICYYDNGNFVLIISPNIDLPARAIDGEINLNCCLENVLKQLAVYLVVRPYDYNGLSSIRRMEYRDNHLFINNQPLIFLEKEPKHCYFTDGVNYDVTRYFKLGEGNSRLNAADGLGTGMIGYSGLPAELTGLKLLFGEKKRPLINWGFSAVTNSVIDVSGCLNRIQSGTAIDQLLDASLKYLKVFCSPFPRSISFYQILALNRFSDGSRSCYYLKECLKRVRWDGILSDCFLGPEKLIVAASDYFKITGDYPFIEKNWPIMKRIGYGIWHQKAKGFLPENYEQRGLFQEEEGFYERYFWISAALKTLAELSPVFGSGKETQLYQDQYLTFWTKLLGTLTNAVRRSGLGVIPLYQCAGYGAGIVRNLVAAYPLNLWDQGNRYIKDSIEFVANKYLCHGGIFSPVDFQGIDLALSARFGQVLIREGYNYVQVLELLIAAASKTWNWPDRIHPLTMDGMGENGHEPEVLYQVLLMLRNILVLEEGEFLDLLPGFFNCGFWQDSQLTINRLLTYFGEISFNCQTIGNLVQIEFWPQYRVKPLKVRLHLPPAFRLIYVDTKCLNKGSILEIDPNFHLLRFKRVKSAGLS